MEKNNKRLLLQRGIEAYKIIKKGNGETHPTSTSTVTVHYTGKLTNGKFLIVLFKEENLLTFPLNRVIPGWTEEAQLMVVGDKFTFIIPSDLYMDLVVFLKRELVLMLH